MHSLFHEVMHLRIDSVYYWHQVVQYVFSVVHSGVHKIPV